MKIFNKISFLIIILTVLLALQISGCSRTKNLISPVVVAIPSSVSDKSITRAIKNASIKRKWLPYDEKEGVISVRLEVRDHIVEVDIEYEETKIRIVYRDSENMLYEEKDDGTILIHKKYNVWVKNLRQDIQLNLAKIEE